MSMRIKVHESKLFFFFSLSLLTNALHCGTIAADYESMRRGSWSLFNSVRNASAGGAAAAQQRRGAGRKLRDKREGADK